MQVSCPACGKDAAVALIADAACDRCGCELSRLRDIRLAAETLLKLARFALESGGYQIALVYADRSWALVRDPLCADVARLAACALGDARRLERWQRREE